MLEVSKASYVNRDVLFETKRKNYVHDSAATTIKEQKSDFVTCSNLSEIIRKLNHHFISRWSFTSCVKGRVAQEFTLLGISFQMKNKWCLTRITWDLTESNWTLCFFRRPSFMRDHLVWIGKNFDLWLKFYSRVLEKTKLWDFPLFSMAGENFVLQHQWDSISQYWMSHLNLKENA